MIQNLFLCFLYIKVVMSLHCNNQESWFLDYLSICPKHNCGHNFSRTCCLIFFKLGRTVHPDSRMNYLNFQECMSKVTVTGPSIHPLLMHTISQECFANFAEKSTLTENLIAFWRPEVRGLGLCPLFSSFAWEPNIPRSLCKLFRKIRSDSSLKKMHDGSSRVEVVTGSHDRPSFVNTLSQGHWEGFSSDFAEISTLTQGSHKYCSFPGLRSKVKAIGPHDHPSISRTLLGIFFKFYRIIHADSKINWLHFDYHRSKESKKWKGSTLVWKYNILRFLCKHCKNIILNQGLKKCIWRQ